jgi:hypothetical protein
MFSSLFKLQLCFITKNRCVPKSTSRKYMLYKILFKNKYICNYINLHFIETFNTDYVRHFHYVRQSDRLTDITSILTWGKLLYRWSESTGFRVTQSGLLLSFDTDS